MAAGRIGENAVGALIVSLATGPPLERWNAAHLLRRLGNGALPAAPFLVNAVGDADADVRSEVVRALGSFDAPPTGVVEAVCLALGDRDPRVRIAAIRSLSSGSYSTPAARTALAEARDDPYVAVWEAAGRALESIAPDAPDPSVAALVGQRPIDPAAIAAADWHQGCYHDEAFTRRLRVEAVTAQSCVRADAVPIVSAALRDADPDVRQWAAKLVPSLGAEAQGVIEEMTPLLDDPSPGVRSATRGSLGKMGPLAAAALQVLRAKALDPRSPDSLEALESLAPIGTPAVPTLMSALADPRPAVRTRTAYLISRASRPLTEAVPNLMVALEDADPGVRRAAVVALGSMGDAAAEAAPAVARLLTDRDQATMQLVGGWLSRLGKAGHDAVAKAFWSGDAKMRRQLVPNLASAEASSPEGISALAAALRDPDVEVRRLAAWKLQRAGCAGARALARAAQSPDAAVAGNAVDYLVGLGALGEIVTGTAPRGSKRIFDRTYHVGVGSKRASVDSGTLWLYFTEWYGPHQLEIGKIVHGTTRIVLTPERLLDLVAPMGNIDEGSFYLLLQTDSGTWYKSKRIALESLWRNLPAHVASLGRCTQSANGEWELVLPEPRTRTVELRDLAGRAQRGVRVPVGMFLGTSGHCGVSDGRPIGTFTTDERGRFDVQASRVELELGLGFYKKRPEGTLCRSDGIVVGASDRITESRLWSLAGLTRRFTLGVRNTDGTPVVGATVREAVCINACGANDGPVGTTDRNGKAEMTLAPDEIELLVVVNADGKRRNLTDKELSELFEAGHLALTW